MYTNTWNWYGPVAIKKYEKGSGSFGLCIDKEGFFKEVYLHIRLFKYAIIIVLWKYGD
jgi:hypothetical protein